MPFRAKMKRALGRGTSAEGDDLTRTDTDKSNKSKKPKKEKLPDNIYKPGEMPKPKYRGPYNKEHQDKLSAFSFGDAWTRRKSSATGTSDLSPMGSRIMSRRGSAWSRRSNKLGSRQNSTFAGVEEGEADDDVRNVGLSRQHTAENRRPRTAESQIIGFETRKTVTSGDTYGLQSQKTITNGQMFTEDELANAMSQSTIKASTRDRD
ncbi:hypothetical protein P7C71_g3114, partial [Lecanoromycetidae sp. Uapishka_2]